MFKVTILGRNGLYPTKDSPCSSYLVTAGDKNILLDLGAGSFSKLLETLAPEKVDMVILSHLHFDHITDVGVYSYYLQTKNKSVELICPFDEERLPLINKATHFKISFIKDGLLDLGGGLKLKFFKTNHPILCYAVSVIYNGKTLSYTADTNDAPFLDELFKTSDLVIADSAFLHKDWNSKKPHLSAKLCAGYAKKYKVKTILSHLNPNQTKEDILNEVSPICDLLEVAEFKEYIV